jgi:peptidoglycan/LPS O-acetylase OafA/YrhL
MEELPKTGKLRKYRPDIDGLRATAIVMVVSWHVGLVNIHGGVDLSFVLSGFLIGSMLLREVDRTGKVSLSKFWARRFRRLAPGASLVIVATLVAAWFYTPLHFRVTATDGLFAALSCLNWRLAVNGTDYFANNGTETPYQHLWSLGIEEQYYVLFPLVLVVVAWASKRVFKSKLLIAVMLVAVIAGSFYLSVTLTPVNQPLAYFGTTSRMWELAVGVLLALSAEQLSRMNQVFAAVLSWVGLAGIIVTGMLITDQTPLPGYAIGGPVLGAALVIAGGCAAPKFGAEVVLGRAVPKFIAKVSYGWYLWHWPLLVLWPSITGHVTLTLNDRFKVFFISLVIATAVYFMIEKKIQANQRLITIPHRGIVMGGLLTTGAAALALVAVLVVPLNVPTASAAATDQVTKVVGIKTVQKALTLRRLPSNVQPSLANASTDATRDGCIDNTDVTVFTLRKNCILGDKTAPGTIVVFGDSHAWQWDDAFNQIGLDLGVRIVTIAKGGCSPGVYKIDNPDLNREYTECDSWRTSALQEIKALHPQVVIITGRARQEATRKGFEQTMSFLEGTHANLVYVTDTPHPKVNVPDCLVSHVNNVNACSLSIKDAVGFPAARAMEQSVAERHGASIIDVVPWFCAEDVCPPVIGGRVAFFDDSHVTRTYANALIPLFEPKIKAVLR